MRTLGSLWVLIILSFLFGSISGYVLWPICARAFHGPFESAGYLVAWPASIAVSLIPLFYFISGFRLIARKKSGFTFLFIANIVLLIILALFSLYMHFVIVSSHIKIPEARILPLVYLSNLSVFVFLVLSVWFYNHRRIRDIFKAVK